MGTAFISILMMMGSLASSGSVDFVRSMMSRKSMEAMSMSVPSTNCTMTMDMFADETEVMFSTLETVLRDSSKGFVTRFSISSGPAPT